MLIYRSSHQRRSMKKGVLRNFAKFTGKRLCQSLFFNKETLLKKRLWHRCFPVNFVKFLGKPILQNISGRLLLLYAKNHWLTLFVSPKFGRNVENKEGLLPYGKYLQKAKSFIFCKHRVNISVRSLSVLCIMLSYHSFARQRVDKKSLVIYFALLHCKISQ